MTVLYRVPYPSAVMCNMGTQSSATFLSNATDQNLHRWSRKLCASFTVPQVSEHFVRLSYIINICVVHQDIKLQYIGPMAYHPPTRFHYSKLLI